MRTCQQYCRFLVAVFPMKYVLYGLVLTKLHLALFREERSGKRTAETFPFGTCTHCCAVCISAPSLLPSARELMWFSCALTDRLTKLLNFQLLSYAPLEAQSGFVLLCFF